MSRFSHSIATAVAAAALTFTLGCGGGAPDATDGDYVQQLMKARAAKDEMFRRSPNEPVPRDKAATLIPLSYFPPDPEYVVSAVLKPSSQGEIMDMPTSTGELRKEERVGVLEFTLKGEHLTLTAFHEAGTDMTHLFVPFRDLTSGTETYQAGRYLDLERTPTGIYNIDFNRAYNPYCYYNSRFDCPYPPAENKLPIPIRAGERLPPTGH
jgi:uncharacterized protein (DUF1684 family)